MREKGRKEGDCRNKMIHLSNKVLTIFVSGMVQMLGDIVAQWVKLELTISSIGMLIQVSVIPLTIY